MDWTRAAQWTFEPLDDDTFPAVALARRVGELGGTYPAVYNAANEQAVEAFHARRVPFLGIVETVRRVVDAHVPGSATLEGVLAAGTWARDEADRLLAGGVNGGRSALPPEPPSRRCSRRLSPPSQSERPPRRARAGRRHRRAGRASRSGRNARS